MTILNLACYELSESFASDGDESLEVKVSSTYLVLPYFFFFAGCNVISGETSIEEGRILPFFVWTVPLLAVVPFKTDKPRILLTLNNSYGLFLSYTLIVHSLWSLRMDLLHELSG